IEMDVWHQGAHRTVHAQLDDAKNDTLKVAEDGTHAVNGPMGLALRPLRPEELRESGVASGLLIEAVSGSAQRAGVQPGDVLLAIDGKPVASVAQASAAVGRLDTSAALLVQRGGVKI